MMNENNLYNQETQQTQQAPEANQEKTDNRFEYMNQKPRYSHKSLVALGVALTLTLALILGSACFVINYVVEAVTQSDDNQDTTIVVSEVGNNQVVTTGEGIDLRAEAPDEDAITVKLLGETPEYTEQPIALALCHTPTCDQDIVTTSADSEYAGCYVLYPNTVYAICWDASPLYDNEEEDVDADITVSSDFLIEEGDDRGVITVKIRDYRSRIDYVGELHIASGGRNLGIEFCSDECHKYAYGFDPEIRDGRFTVCFYTSGGYIEKVSNSISSVDGYYRFTYGTEGSVEQEILVNRWDHRPEPTPEKPSVKPDLPKPDPDPRDSEPTTDPTNDKKDPAPADEPPIGANDN